MATGSPASSASGPKIFLAVSALLLLVSGAVAYLRLQAPSAAADGSAAGKPYQAPNIADLQQQYKSLSADYQTARTNLYALVSDVRVACTNADHTLLPWTAEVCWKCNTPQPKRGAKTDTDGDGIPDVVELANGLDPNRNDAMEDKDGDGFRNGEEIAAGTKPNDPSSHPSLIAKLRVARVMDSPIPFILKEITSVAGTFRFQVSIAGVDKLSVKLGEVVAGWTLKSFDEASKTLTIVQDGESFELPRGKRVEKNQRVALVVSMVDAGFRVQVKNGDVLKLKGADHPVIGVAAAAVTVRIPGAQAPVKIPLATAQEVEAIKALWSGGGKTPPGGSDTSTGLE